MPTRDPGALRSSPAHRVAAAALVLVSLLAAWFIIFAWAFPYEGCIHSIPAANCFNSKYLVGCVPNNPSASACHPNVLAGILAIGLLIAGVKSAVKVWRG